VVDAYKDTSLRAALNSYPVNRETYLESDKIRDTKDKIQNTMYHKQIKIFAILLTFFLFVFLLRLAQMQLLSNSFYRDKITKLRLQKSHSRQFKTVRGKILDRNGKVLAVDEPQFQLYINYGLTCFMDDRVREGNLLKAADKKDDTGASAAKAQKELDDGLADLNQIISKCAQLGGVKPTEVKTEIQKINDFIWKRRTFQAWRDNFPNSEVFENYKNIISIPDYAATADFEKKEANPVERLRLINKVDIAEMHKNWPLVELKTDDDIFTAQLEFSDIDDVQILAKGQRFYPFGPAAAQTIGWVGPATQQADRQLFADDKLSRYLDDEVCGREDGVEYACETILRGKRGKIVYDIDRELIDETKAQLGKDVSLTLDIELQQRIEKYLTDCEHNPNCRAPMAAVVIDVASGDILALVSTPVFDLNRIRRDYAGAAGDPNEPLRNRAINKQYPPGSVVKPLILIAGLESGKITADEIIHCPAQEAPKGWPNCWLYNKYHWTGHDDMWQNNARNAIKGSCNIYFSRLADRIEPQVLQQWLSAFGYGHVSSLVQAGGGDEARDLRQAPGQISTIPAISSFEQLPPLNRSERRYFGIGQGNLRATPLQAANAMAAIARGGVLKQPRLFKEILNSKSEIRNSDEINLGISAETLKVVYDGMYAVVNEPDGTAYKEFATAGLAEQGVKVYGKTGSTEEPANAWFSGFAEDRKGRKLAIAVVVEGGQHGSSDAAPLARDIIQFCIEARYIGGK
jgi:penicillin-binding protein 2